MKKWVSLGALLVFLSGCITTRTTIAEEKEKSETKINIANLREGTANLDDQVRDLQEQFRELTGKVEMADGRYRSLSEDERMQSAQLEEKWKAFSGRFELLMNSVSQLEEKVSRMSDEMVAMKKDIANNAANNAKAVSRPAPKRAEKKGNFATAEDYFASSNWKDAALNYQKYREKNPNGKYYEKATFRMGVCFKKLKLGDEAKVFFNELVDRFPKGTYAKDARQELKSLK